VSGDGSQGNEGSDADGDEGTFREPGAQVTESECGGGEHVLEAGLSETEVAATAQISDVQGLVVSGSTFKGAMIQNRGSVLWLRAVFAPGDSDAYPRLTSDR